jgi:murein DD-endopeptidase MepM/ murein hydrolase activator NlpD
MTLPEPHSLDSQRRPTLGRALPALLGALIVVASSLSSSTPAAGLETARSRLDRIRTELRDAKTDADKNDKLIDELNGQLRLVQRELRQARSEQKAAGVEREQADAAAVVANSDVARLRQLIGERARAVYMTGGTGQLEALTGSASPEAMLERVSRLDTIAREDSRIMPDLQAALTIAENAQQRIASAEARRAAAIQDVEQRGEDLRDTRAVKVEAQQRLDARVAKYREDIAVILTESAAIAAELAGNGSGNVGKLLRPVSCPQTSGFGIRWGRMHEGLDFGCDIGTPVKAAKAGLVIKAGLSSGYGNLVLVDHGDGVVTAYAHNSRFAVEIGDDVAAGQVIAYSGNTGHSTGPHVHFEVRINGVPKNPALYL